MSDEVRDDLKYTDTHEWVDVKGKTAIVGITDHAQSELTDIVFAELPEVGKEISKGDELCVVENCTRLLRTHHHPAFATDPLIRIAVFGACTFRAAEEIRPEGLEAVSALGAVQSLPLFSG